PERAFQERVAFMLVSRGWCWLLIGSLLLSSGCTTGKRKKDSAAVKEQVADSFEKLKEAIADVQKGHTEKLWDIMSDVNIRDANKKAKAFRAEFAKWDKEEQVEFAQQVGATAEDVRDKLNGYGYIRLMRDKLYDRYWMVAAAPIDHIKMEAEDEASVYYKPDDADQEKQSITFILEDGQWKAKLNIP